MHARNVFRMGLFLLPLVFSVLAIGAPAKPLQVLFVGNSLTYVNNLPAVFTALAQDNGHPARADMLVKGGATLAQWQASGAVTVALAAHHYDFVVLQERGNDFACGFGPEACRDARQALETLAKVVRDAGATPVLLGTYQASQRASDTLVAAESKAAAANTMPYLAISPALSAGRQQMPYGNWFAKAGHPGHDLALLEAVSLYRQLCGAMPKAQALVIHAPMFVPESKFAPPDPVSRPLLPDIPLAGGYRYSSQEVALATALVH